MSSYTHKVYEVLVCACVGFVAPAEQAAEDILLEAPEMSVA